MNKKGYTLIELIVVVALMGLAISVVGISLSYIQSTRVKDCAEKMNYAIETTRVNAMSRTGDNKVEFYKSSDGVYMIRTAGGITGSAEKIGGSSISVKYVISGAEQELGDSGTGNDLVFEFDKASGAFKGLTPQKIILSGSGKEMTISLYKRTGKTILE
ncbi:MAG: type II secretion system protein [Oscillospiraceae bacterium]|nr:type II secretion system protein [Oscillospiraceae bacterium]